LEARVSDLIWDNGNGNDGDGGDGYLYGNDNVRSSDIHAWCISVGRDMDK
jgi:hypothetical protein